MTEARPMPDWPTTQLRRMKSITPHMLRRQRTWREGEGDGGREGREERREGREGEEGGGREGRREGGREGGRKGGREERGGKERKEKGKEGGKEEGKEGGKAEGKEGGRIAREMNRAASAVVRERGAALIALAPAHQYSLDPPKLGRGFLLVGLLAALPPSLGFLHTVCLLSSSLQGLKRQAVET